MKTDTASAAKLAGLVISDRSATGITRKKIVEDEDSFHWEYYSPKGRQISQKHAAKLDSLTVPPAWIEVWFCPQENGHIQATGKDAKGRLQYRYHPEWIKLKAALKFEGVDEFALSLPYIRERVDADLLMRGMPFEKVVALVIKLMDLFHIRVGSDEYAKSNESYGLTTLKEGHMKIIRGKKAEGKLDAIFDFPGKSGKRWRLRIEDDDLAKMIERSGKVGGKDKNQDLFRYEANGRDFDIKAEHINRYIYEATETSYTAKDFRTWAASWKCGARLALISEASDEELQELPALLEEEIAARENTEDEPIINWRGVELKRSQGLAKLAAKNNLQNDTAKDRQAALLAVIDTVAGDLGNTRAVCRSSYIRPMFMEDWTNGVFMQRWQRARKKPSIPLLSEDESAAVHYMREHE